MYNNLLAEMARLKLTRIDLAKGLGVRNATVADKINGKYSFTLDEAFKIRDQFFPGLDIEYLFKVESRTA